MRGAGFYEAGLVGVDDGLGSVAEVELGEEVGDVGLDGRFADDELGGDLGVGVAAGDEFEHLELARGQFLQAGGVGVGHRGAAEEALDQPAGDRGREQGSPATTVRMAATSCSGGASLSRKPLAPACSAS